MQQVLTGILPEGKSGGKSPIFIIQSPNYPSWSENSHEPGGIQREYQFIFGILTSFPLHFSLALLQLPPILPLAWIWDVLLLVAPIPQVLTFLSCE